MTKVPRISEAEWEVMKIVWAQSPKTSMQIMEQLEERMSWKPTTVKTLVSRLVKKGVLGFHKEGKNYSYFPLLLEEECLQAESRSFLNRLYGGSLQPLLVSFLKEERLSKEDIKELRRLLDEKSGE
nr:BlaI/MecI/CopY family transcriptional regulator [Paenibacillus sp.]